MHPKYWKRKALNHVYRDEAGEGSAGGGALDMNSAAAAFASLSASADEPNPAGVKSQSTSDEMFREPPKTEEEAVEQLAQDEVKDEAAPKEEQDDSTDTVTIKVDGKDVQMTKAELAEHYKNGLRQADYTRKTMETAEARKAAEAEANKAKAERDSYAEKLQHFAIQQNGTIQELQSQLTEELLTSDPVEYLKLERTLHARQAQLQQAQQELQQIGLQQKQEQEQSAQSYRAQQLEALQAKLPEWKDPAKAKAEADKIKDFLMANEFASEDIAQLGDHRLILLARKAMQFDALQAKAREAVKKVQAAPAKVEKPGNSQVAPTDGRTRAMKQLSETGSLRDAANVFAALRSN